MEAHPILAVTGHRPWPLPERNWRMTQRWSNLLFAHWPVPAADVQRLLPAGLEVDCWDGSAWVGVVPFEMDRVRTRTPGGLMVSVPSAAAFPELNLRTYVRSPVTKRPGVFFFSLDAASLLAVMGARSFFHLPYFWAKMWSEERPDGLIHYSSQRRVVGQPVEFLATYRPTGPVATSQPDPQSLEYFLTERYSLYTANGANILTGNIHHLPWPLQAAEAEIVRNDLPVAHGINLPNRAPVLHFARELSVYIWSLEPAVALV